MKKACIFLFFILSWGISAQNYTDNWEGFFSFYHIEDLAYGPQKIYTAAENAIFVTDINSLAQQKITTLNGLSGENISALAYNNSHHTLIIGYVNGLLQLYNLDKKTVKTFVDIIQKPTLTPKQRKINNFYIQGNRLFIATNYGISVFRLDNLEFGDTYYIGNNGGKLAVNALTVFNQKIYAATQGEGLKYAALSNPNLVNYHSWQQIGSGNFAAIVSFQNNVYALQGKTLQKLQQGNSLTPALSFTNTVQDMKTAGKYLTVTFSNKVQVYKKNLILVTPFSITQYQPHFTTALAYNEQLFIGDQKLGLIKATLNNVSAIQYLSPNGPLHNNIYAFDIASHHLWAIYGTYNLFYNPYAPNGLHKTGISHYTQGQWINIPYNILSQELSQKGLPNKARSLFDIIINPQKPEQAFVSSYHDGLLELNANQVQNFYTPANSTVLQKAKSSNPNESNDAIRLGPLLFDPQGALWMGNATSKFGLLKLPAQGGTNDFVTYDVSGIMQNSAHNLGYGDIVRDRSGNIYLATYEEGVVGYDNSTQQFAKLKGGKGQGNLPNNYISSLAIDHNHTLWIAARQGLRVLYNPTQIFTNPNAHADNIVFLDKNGVAQELFAGLSITDIAVDGNNNKWIGSLSGVYYIAADGQKTLLHFTTDNSPLPSNTINEIKIEGTTGKVYIATQRGLVVYRGKATDAAQDLSKLRAYPNPVRPAYHGVVTIDGLMENADVKITDIEGNLVYEKIAEGGSIQWNTTAFGRYKVASGVYFVMVTSDDQQHTKVIKIMIIR